ncbi:hypothetical protein E7T09_06760 [Deinococcus sp. KSM4-11]|uniref:DUF6683 family protein n=1 Tax=Deinococcus sp. KSM4-11 TaxID=2568654 RepID=UPI0010A361F1|nr:DUF6683 family protein [Deinococcus sp. KSM4-11]THF88864.1 hypothetical protein E7T09_06760 [Deinococcus sp. KSM4-11]
MAATALVGLLGWSGQAQFFTPSFQNYQTFAQRSVGYVAATVRPDFTAKAVQQALSPQTTPVKYKYALSRSDFPFKGSPTQQKTCAAMVQKPDDQRQMATLCLKLFAAAQDIPDFRKNNLASGLALLIGVSLQVSTGSELTDAETDALYRGLNDVLIDAGVMKGKPAEIQAMYETAVMTGALIAGVAQVGTDDHNADMTTVAQTLALVVLKGFGLK